MSKKLELNRETLRDLSDASLAEATGGEGVPTKQICDTQTFACPSGATWFADCQSTWIQCN